MSLSLKPKTLWPSLINPLLILLPVLKNNLPSSLSLKLVTCNILKFLLFALIKIYLSFKKLGYLIKPSSLAIALLALCCCFINFLTSL